MKFLSGGNQTASIIALCSLRDYDLASESCQYAIRDVGGLELLVNLLETEDSRCKIGALRVLKEVAMNYHVKAAMANLDAIRPLVTLLADDMPEVCFIFGVICLVWFGFCLVVFFFSCNRSLTNLTNKTHLFFLSLKIHHHKNHQNHHHQ